MAEPIFRGVIFDLDGVMFDTERLCLNGWKEAFGQTGYTAEPHIFIDIVGLSAEDTKSALLKHLPDEASFDQLKRLRDAYVTSYIEKYGLPIKPGLLELLAYLKTNGYGMTVATSTEREKVSFYFRKAEIENYFDRVACREMIERPKPDPEIYLKACEIMEARPDECLALEDSYAGIRAAHRAGVKPVMIPDLAAPDNTIKKIVYAILPTLADVITLLD